MIMTIKVEEGYMRGVVVDKDGNNYVYYGNDVETGKNLFLSMTDNRWYEEVNRDINTGDVNEIKLKEGDVHYEN